MHMLSIFLHSCVLEVYQTGELGCIEEDNPKMQQLLSLRTALYSEEFRKFISAVTGCEELTDRVDCSANAYVAGKQSQYCS